MSDVSTAPDASGGAYRVLARKYRPQDFSALIGQDALVRTVTNAITSGRIAQAYMLTGVRGVGKTTTARIIARALNCIGPDGTGNATPEPCGVCEHCVAIAEDRHVDVLEMDAASRTGVDDMRELLDGVRYRPTSARTKVYIIDEVHMLSIQAFNALLKTLEEPPEHVKFIFATTEIRKVPVTVLSRCQRFDLRRVEAAELFEHFSKIATEESAALDEGAMKLICRAADGSVRDGLSLLDQAIAHAELSEDGQTKVSETEVRDMLGLADREIIFDTFDALMKGETQTVLDLVRRQYDAGANPVVLLQDLLELTHWLTRLKMSPDAADDLMAAEAERTRGKDMAAALSMKVLTRTWQMLLKGLSEARSAPVPLQAVEMALIRLAYAADLPPPDEVIKSLDTGDASSPAAPRPAPPSSNGNGATATAVQTQPAQEPEPTPQPTAQALPQPQSLIEVVDILEQAGEMKYAVHLYQDVHEVLFQQGRIDLRVEPAVPKDFAGKVAETLSAQTGERWVISLVNEPGAETLKDQAEQAARQDPVVQSMLEAFPGARMRVKRAPKDETPDSKDTP